MLIFPAQPSSVACLISSKVATFFLFPASTPMKSSIVPVGRASWLVDEFFLDRNRTPLFTFLWSFAM